MAFSLATMMSQARASSSPPPSAKPLTAAIIGFQHSKSPVMPPKPPRTGGKRMTPFSATVSAWNLRSLPAEKARSPAPVSTPIQAESSSRKVCHASESSAEV